MSDPEDVTRLRPADLAEVEVDESPEDSRARPLEADAVDVAEQRQEIADDERRDGPAEY
jgi:hypothetical protein